MDNTERVAKLETLAMQAHDFLNEYEQGLNKFRLPATEGHEPEDMDIDPKQMDAYDEYRADWNESAMDLAKMLADLADCDCD